MNKKALLLSLCALLLVTASVFGTVAYLTSMDTVVNTFTVGNVKITLDEANVDTAGEVIPNTERVKGNTYHLIPGKTYTKDPTMTVKQGSEESYLRMLVTFDKLNELDAIFAPAGADLLSIFGGYDATEWEYAGKSEKDNTITYEFRYTETVDGFNDAGEKADEELPALFTSFTLPGDITGGQLDTIKDLNITVVGHAIQKAGFDTDDAAWAAFK